MELDARQKQNRRQLGREREREKKIMELNKESKIWATGNGDEGRKG